MSQTNEQSALPTTFAIVGAGPAGLVAARAFRRYGLDVEILERWNQPGGLWNIDQPGSPLYDSCNFICSRDFGGFIGYPMPADYPIYPRWDQIRDYIQAFARHEGLDQLITFGADVSEAKPVSDERGDYWVVTTADGRTKEYRGVVYAGGAQWTPFRPAIPGEETFTGEIIHSAEYNSTRQFHDKRVLVVGAGNSGVDIVSDAAFHAKKAYLSTRRGYWFFPKVAYGTAVPDIFQGLAQIPPTSLFDAPNFEQAVELIVAGVGDLSTYGLPQPDHAPATTHPIANNQVLHALSHGLLEHRPGIDRIDGSTVYFTDGRELELDLIVLATGFDIEIPWLPEGAVEEKDGHPQFVLGALAPHSPGLYASGVLHFADCTFSMFDELVNVAAADANALVNGDNLENIERLRREYRPNLQGDFPFLQVRRNVNQINVPTLRAVQEELRTEFGIEIPHYPGDEDFYKTPARNAAVAV